MHRPSFGEMTTFLKMEDISFHSVTSKIQNLSAAKELYSNKGNQKLLFGETKFEQNGVNLDYTK